MPDRSCWCARARRDPRGAAGALPGRSGGLRPPPRRARGRAPLLLPAAGVRRQAPRPGAPVPRRQHRQRAVAVPPLRGPGQAARALGGAPLAGGPAPARPRGLRPGRRRPRRGTRRRRPSSRPMLAACVPVAGTPGEALPLPPGDRRRPGDGGRRALRAGLVRAAGGGVPPARPGGAGGRRQRALPRRPAAEDARRRATASWERSPRRGPGCGEQPAGGPGPSGAAGARRGALRRPLAGGVRRARRGPGGDGGAGVAAPGGGLPPGGGRPGRRRRGRPGRGRSAAARWRRSRGASSGCARRRVGGKDWNDALLADYGGLCDALEARGLGGASASEPVPPDGEGGGSGDRDRGGAGGPPALGEARPLAGRRAAGRAARGRWRSGCGGSPCGTRWSLRAAFCANDAFFGRRAFAGEGEPFGGVKVKGEIERLLGYARRRDPAADPLLATSDASDAASGVRSDLLPACRGGCGCTGPA